MPQSRHRRHSRSLTSCWKQSQQCVNNVYKLLFESAVFELALTICHTASETPTTCVFRTQAHDDLPCAASLVTWCWDWTMIFGTYSCYHGRSVGFCRKCSSDNCSASAKSSRVRIALLVASEIPSAISQLKSRKKWYSKINMKRTSRPGASPSDIKVAYNKLFAKSLAQTFGKAKKPRKRSQRTLKSSLSDCGIVQVTHRATEFRAKPTPALTEPC